VFAADAPLPESGTNWHQNSYQHAEARWFASTLISESQNLRHPQTARLWFPKHTGRRIAAKRFRTVARESSPWSTLAASMGWCGFRQPQPLMALGFFIGWGEVAELFVPRARISFRQFPTVLIPCCLRNLISRPFGWLPSFRHQLPPSSEPTLVA
jgi:hypothetical protein